MKLKCAGCGAEYERMDMLEVYVPALTVVFDQPITISRLGWVGPCCTSLANQWQPDQPFNSGSEK